MATPAPRWDLSNVFPGLESKEYQNAIEKLQDLIAVQEENFKTVISNLNAKSSLTDLANAVEGAINAFNELDDLASTLGAYLHSFISTDSHNNIAKRKESEFEQNLVRLQKLSVGFTTWIGKLADKIPALIEANPTAAAHAFMLKETSEQSKYLMPPEEEGLAAELSLSGASAWNKLQGTVTSQLTVDFELDGEVQKMPMPALINLHSHPDADVRKRAYEAEMTAWKTVEEPLAA